MKESHSSMKVRVFSTPRVSEPQCSRPKLEKSLRTSSRSLDEMSQCLLSFISVKSQGLMRAPLKRTKVKHTIRINNNILFYCQIQVRNINYLASKRGVISPVAILCGCDPLSYCKSKKAQEINCWLCTTETPHKNNKITRTHGSSKEGSNAAIELKLTAN